MPKYHNYKLEGLLYVDKGGHDSNSGSDPNAPRKTAGTTGINMYNANIFGAGVYQIGYVLPAAKGDGKVVLKPATEGTWFSCSGNHNYVNLEMWYPDFNQNISSTAGTDTDDCIIRFGKGVVGSSSSARRRRFTRCVFFDSNMGQNLSGTGSIALFQCIVIRTNIYTNDWGQFEDSYVGPDSSIISLYGGISASYFKSCNIQGRVVINGVSYELKKKKDGTPYEGADPTVPDLATLAGYEGIYTTQKCFNQNPKFSNPQAEDFTLQADSPHIRAASDGNSNIGGTKVGSSVRNTDDGNAAGIRVLPTAGMNTTNPEGYILKAGETEAYVDYVFPLPGLPMTTLDVADLFNFDTAYAGGTVQNSNVVDAEPQTADYARYVQTTAVAADTSTLVVPAGAIAVGKHVWVNGQGREVISKTTSGANDTLTLSSPLLAAIGTGVVVTFGTEAQLAALHPNRLTVWFRTRSSATPPSIPLVASEWDNEVNASFGVAGKFFNQEVAGKPGLIVYNGQVWGAGDSAAPVGILPSEIAGMWGNCRVFKRNNQSSIGLPWQG